MIDLAKLFDGYNRQARVYPALITLFPPLLMLIAWFPEIVTSNLAATLVTVAASCGLFYALASFSRTQGKRTERRLLKDWGGWPTTHWLRHRDGHLTPETKRRYQSFLSDRLPSLEMPDAVLEERDMAGADRVYASAVEWLKEQCRGDQFSMVEKENAEYGFRRNLRGMKPYGLASVLLALIAAVGAVCILGNNMTVDPTASLLSQWSTRILVATPQLVWAALLVSLVALLFWLFVVRDRWVREAGDQYARALLACCDTLNR